MVFAAPPPPARVVGRQAVGEGRASPSDPSPGTAPGSAPRRRSPRRLQRPSSRNPRRPCRSRRGNGPRAPSPRRSRCRRRRRRAPGPGDLSAAWITGEPAHGQPDEMRALDAGGVHHRDDVLRRARLAVGLHGIGYVRRRVAAGGEGDASGVGGRRRPAAGSQERWLPPNSWTKTTGVPLPASSHQRRMPSLVRAQAMVASLR